jgi:hypothetical protein
MKKNLTVNCPSCGETIAWSEQYPDRPFCSTRCKNSDFVDWANEEKRIAGSAQYDDVFSESNLPATD